MNNVLLYQFEEMLSAHMPCLNTGQQAHVALFSYGVPNPNCRNHELHLQRSRRHAAPSAHPWSGRT